jgi:prevent-host-death family protein
MKTVSAAVFKIHCLRIMEDVRRHGEAVTVTNKGKPVVKLTPADKPYRDIFGCMAGTAAITGDIEAPVVPIRAWKTAR